MRKAEKLKQIWKLFHHLNKKFCKDKIVIKKIIFFKKDKSKKEKFCSYGYYDRKEKIIGIRERMNEGDVWFPFMMRILCHELAHAYLYTLHYEEYKAKLNKPKRLTKDKRYRISHDEGFIRIWRKFLFELDKMVVVRI